MTRYEQWRANPSSVQPQAPASSTPSSLHCHDDSLYEQSPTEDNRARRERLDALLRYDPLRDKDVYPADGAREDRTRLRRRREEEVRRWVAEQRRPEQDGILRLQREAEYAVQAARLRQPTGQNQGVTGPIMPDSSLQYPSISASAITAWDPYGPITAYLPLESPTRCVIFRAL
jgi:hypothetical protein